MLLESFKKNLKIIRGFAAHRMGIIDPVSLGDKMCQSFIAEIKAALLGDPARQGVFPDFCETELSHVGKIIRKRDAVFFEPCDELLSDSVSSVLRLAPFLEEWIGTANSHFLGTINWRTIFQRDMNMLSGERMWFPCQPFLSNLGVDILVRSRRKDRMLKKISFEKCAEAFCLYIHDAVATGCGIEIETIGKLSEYTFAMDTIFKQTLDAEYHAENAKYTDGLGFPFRFFAP